MADGDSVRTSSASGLRAVDEFRSSNSVPEACDLTAAGLVASLLLEDADAMRAEVGDRIEHTVAGTPARELVARLREIEQLAFAAQRLRVEALSARFRYDLSTMERRSADVFFHISEAGEAMRNLAPLVDRVRAEPAAPVAAVDVESRVDTDLEPPAAPPDMPSRIVAAALGLDHTTAPSFMASVPPPAPEVTNDDSTPPATGLEPTPRMPDGGGTEVDKPVWMPPVFVPPEPQRGPVGEWRARQRRVQAERQLIRADEKKRGRGLRPRLPTWLSQAFATVVVVTLMAVVVIGAWMLLVSGAGPF